eukprot:comp22654_c0_seq1/m.34932 comp22654_c0_seq1/g.34932  ORF comp22654_c0_seq1/g.34932 comp22654_c0_seq1/m.34932 type:complete len:535 (-) comp22654_c0_seq1:566-2170(-)
MAQETILQRIYAQRKLDVTAAKASVSEDELRAIINDPATCFPLIDFPARLRKSINTPSSKMALLAEVKRASPSKGDIAKNTDAADQAWAYARGGADAISVLTEPTWFKGGLADMRAVRHMLGRNMTEATRPAVLRKDFIFDSYQLLEARAYGADTVLLIVKMLDDGSIEELLRESRALGMEPLVEVNNAEEMERALRLGSRVIGVNNRNLNDFQVDLHTTSNLVSMVPPDVILIALSGISCREDVAAYEPMGVGAVLVGEALMRASDPRVFVNELLGRDAAGQKELATCAHQSKVKICGLRSVEAAVCAARAGADLLGMIYVDGAKRKITTELGQSIRQAVNVAMGMVPGSTTKPQPVDEGGDVAGALLAIRRPALVGVFQNQRVEDVNMVAQIVGLDFVQLHGEETEDLASSVCVPVIKVVHVGKASAREDVIGQVQRWANAKNVALVLLDTMSATGQQGGSGEAFDWTIAEECRALGLRFVLAGGLSPQSVADAATKVQPYAVDVSSGVETDGAKDFSKIASFVANAKGWTQ